MAKGFWKASRWLGITFAILLALILLVVTLLNFGKFKCRSKQSEARVELMNLFNVEKFFFAQNLRYETLDRLKSLDLVTVRDKFYAYTSEYANDKGFAIRAVGKPGTQVAGDSWRVDQKGVRGHIHNACRDE
jgi:Tfp pilus assembly protein PilE